MQNHLDRADGYLETKEVAAAIIELKNAIQAEPDNPLPRYRLGSLYLSHGDFPSATKELLKAMSLGSTEQELYPKIGLSFLSTGLDEDLLSFTAVMETEDPVIAANMDAMTLVVIAASGRGQDNPEAKRLYDAVETSGVDSFYTKLAKARYIASIGELEQGLSLMVDVTKDHPDESFGWLTRGHIETMLRRAEEGSRSYKTASELAPAARYYALFLAQSLIREQKVEEAEPYIDGILAIANNHVFANEMKAAVRYALKDYEAARNHSIVAIQNGSANLSQSLIAGASLFRVGEYEQAIRHLSRVVSLMPENQLAQKLFSLTQLQLGEVDNAVAALREMDIESDLDSQFLSLASVELAKAGQIDDALQLSKKASASGNPDDIARLGMVKLVANNDEGLDDIETAIAADPENEGMQLALVYLHLRTGNVEKADMFAKQMLPRFPDSANASIANGIVSQGQNDIASAKEWFQKAIDQHPDGSRPHAMLARLYANEKAFDKAYELMYEVKQKQPESGLINEYLVAYALQENKMDSVVELLDKQINEAPANRTLLQHKALALYVSDNKTGARELLETIPAENRDVAMWRMLFVLYRDNYELGKAQLSAKGWINAVPLATEGYIRSIEIFKRSRQWQAGLEQAQNAAGLFPADRRFNLLVAEMYWRLGKPEASQRVLDTFPPDFAATAAVLQLQNWVHLAKGNTASAIEGVDKLYEISPGDFTATEVAAIYSESGKTKQAIAFLDDVMEKSGERPPLLMKKAELMIGENTEKSIAYYLKVIKESPHNIVALNNLSWLYLENDNLDDACEFAKLAYEQASSRAEIIDTYGYCQLRKGDIQQAVSLLTRAHQANKYEPEITLHYAESLIMDGQVSRAKLLVEGVDANTPALKSLKAKLRKML